MPCVAPGLFIRGMKHGDSGLLGRNGREVEVTLASAVVPQAACDIELKNDRLAPLWEQVGRHD